MNVFGVGKVTLSQLLSVFDSDEFRQHSQNQPKVGDKLFCLQKKTMFLAPAKMYVTCYHQNYCDMKNVNVESEKEICCNICDVETWNHCGSVGGGNVAENIKLAFSSSKRPDNLKWMFFAWHKFWHISRTNFIINVAMAPSSNSSDQYLWNLVASSVTLSEASEARGGKVWCGPLLLVFTFVFVICICICNLYL